MLLLFVGGVMNLVWIAGLTLLVAIEKLAPFGAAAAKTDRCAAHRRRRDAGRRRALKMRALDG